MTQFTLCSQVPEIVEHSLTACSSSSSKQDAASTISNYLLCESRKMSGRNEKETNGCK